MATDKEHELSRTDVTCSIGLASDGTFQVSLIAENIESVRLAEKLAEALYTGLIEAVRKVFGEEAQQADVDDNGNIIKKTMN